MAGPKPLHRGFTTDVIESKNPTQGSIHRNWGIDEEDPLQRGNEEEEDDFEEEEGDGFGEMRSLEGEGSGGDSEQRRRGDHTMYHGTRQHSFFKKGLVLVSKITKFDDDDSDIDSIVDERSINSDGIFNQDSSTSVVSNLTEQFTGSGFLFDEPSQGGEPISYNCIGNPASDYSVDSRSHLSVTESEKLLDPLIFDNTVDDDTIAEYASYHGIHKFPDPDIKGHKIQQEMSINSVHHVFNKKVDYKKAEIFPEWILESTDWKKMRGIIKDRELMLAMTTPNHMRDHIQIDLIRKWLVGAWDMARHLGIKRCTALAKAVQYTEVKDKEVIINEGERGYTFYIIIDGTVAIYKKGYGKITTLGKGKFFGERALTSDKYEYRQATVVCECKPFCKLLVLHKSDYDSIIRNYQESIRTEAYKVLKSVTLFKNWSRSRLERVCSMLERREVPANTLIFKQGDLPDFIYFIVDGNIEIIKEITVSSTNRWPSADGGHEEKVRKFVNKFKILDIGSGKYFGEIAIVNNTVRAATCQTTVPTTLLALDKFEFLHLLNKGHAMANVYSQTQGYPNDEDILNLFSQLKVQKAQSKAIKDTRGGGYGAGMGGLLAKRSKKNKKSAKLKGSSAVLAENKGHTQEAAVSGMAEGGGEKAERSKSDTSSENPYQKLLEARKRKKSEMRRQVNIMDSISLPSIESSPVKDPNRYAVRAHRGGNVNSEKVHKDRLAHQRKVSILVEKRRTAIGANSNSPGKFGNAKQVGFGSHKGFL
ncbi:hypothetical protein TrLO_g8334 [Triparma laevis f. longispina]|uniref:Cyclic nucleotide-binding domain-containing protein n=1 Tax=Triparma laevis f. longispina TaxID=1714387 RepID=A0A9W7FE22_9STRA|nr:hypothetical protein TrLO_g8334 [Triparma laevis f. longispina]